MHAPKNNSKKHQPAQPLRELDTNEILAVSGGHSSVDKHQASTNSDVSTDGKRSHKPIIITTT